MTSSQPGPKLVVSAWPAVSRNRYVADLYRLVQDHDPGIEVLNFDVTRAWSTRPDVVHVHWPEAAANSASLLRAGARTAMVLADLEILNRRGTRIVWTCHNLASHDNPHPRLESVLRRRFYRLVDGVIHLTEASQRAMADHPVLGSVPSVVVPHGLFTAPSDVEPPTRAEARLKLGLDPDEPIIGFVGMIRPYKNVPTLIEAFGRLDRPARLLVAGSPFDDEVRSAVRRAAEAVTAAPGSSDRVLLEDRWLSDDELAGFVRAADVIVLPYREVHNSGVAILAAGLGRPVAVKAQGSMASFVDAVGADWAYPLQTTITSEELGEVLSWAMAPRSGSPDLSAFDNDKAAIRTAEFFRQIASGAGPA